MTRDTILVTNLMTLLKFCPRMSLIEKEIWSWIQLRLLQLIIPQSFLGFDAFDSPWESPPPHLHLPAMQVGYGGQEYGGCDVCPVRTVAERAWLHSVLLPMTFSRSSAGVWLPLAQHVTVFLLPGAVMLLSLFLVAQGLGDVPSESVTRLLGASAQVSENSVSLTHAA